MIPHGCQPFFCKYIVNNRHSALDLNPSISEASGREPLCVNIPYTPCHNRSDSCYAWLPDIGVKDPVTLCHGIVADEMDVFHKYIIAQNQKNRNGFELLIGAKEAKEATRSFCNLQEFVVFLYKTVLSRV